MKHSINSKRNALRKWECALVLALCFTICYGVFALRSQQGLAQNVIRLHVVAQSDSDYDQQVKLEVRDSLLELLTPELESAGDTENAAEIINGSLTQLESLAEEISGLSATVSLEYESFPTRYYDTFSLPAGEYLSLRVTLGEGEGKNWWCVVFPPLCMAAAEESSVSADSLTDEEVRLITEDGAEYQIRFKVLEYVEKIKEFFE